MRDTSESALQFPSFQVNFLEARNSRSLCGQHNFVKHRISRLTAPNHNLEAKFHTAEFVAGSILPDGCRILLDSQSMGKLLRNARYGLFVPSASVCFDDTREKLEKLE
ncbi:hypothetical protein AX14_012900 [Amanita brunnescens Koide BX004]|nr:hypothetical protein AX14_012900 [Amanita brunnescens Koide BX004]